MTQKSNSKHAFDLDEYTFQFNESNELKKIFSSIIEKLKQLFW